MLRPRKTIDDAANRARLDTLVGLVHREAAAAEADPFDVAMIAAVAGVAESLKSEAAAVAELEARFGKLARKALAPG